ncbi:MAG: isocitrate/isopropylmalate family dehydrogenase [Thermodesulfovibrionia bacterium]|nr:isocitrate/isopropylmalate family dehydrogenase [Thermodesulfovibrionia bacterium]
MDDYLKIEKALNGKPQRWSDQIFEPSAEKCIRDGKYIVGVLEGEGIGPEIISAALIVLSALESKGECSFEVRKGGPIGRDAELQYGKALCDPVVDFCRDIFSKGGAVLAGPGGGRFVYDMRREFDLFCKISPIRGFEELRNTCRIPHRYLTGTDIILIRENSSGIYQGRWSETVTGKDGRRAEHSFCYTEREVCRILKVAAKTAQLRQGEITVVFKDAGIPSISRLWHDCMLKIASEFGVRSRLMDIDYAAYYLIQHSQELDVVVSPNLFGDILSDVGGVLLGSRALSYSGNFSEDGSGVYQTNHGAGYDIAGTGRANPIGQIFSLAMMLRESFGLMKEALLIESAVTHVWRQGWRTADLAEDSCRLAGTQEMGELIAETITRMYSSIEKG